MTRRFTLPLLALAGIAFALFVVRQTNRETAKAQPVAAPPEAPFSSYVSGAGLVEAPGEEVSVAASTAGVVTRVFVRAGDPIAKGQQVFQLDDGPKKAELMRHEAALLSAREKLAKVQLGTRQEEIPPQEAQVAQARAALADARSQLAIRESVRDVRAISTDELTQARHNVRQKEEQLRYAEAQLALLKAGAWQPDIGIAKTDVIAAEAQVRQASVELDRLTVRSPLDGEVLQVNVRPGEFAAAGNLSRALVLVGRTDVLDVRADVDENDAWRVRRNAPAVAYPRGRRDLKIPLEFVRIEPYVVPKRNLTGDSTERVDTRVLQVIYRFWRLRSRVAR